MLKHLLMALTSVVLLTSALVFTPAHLSAFSLFRRSEPKKLVIPDFESAREQYAYAASLQAAMLPSFDKNRRRIQLDRIIQCYSKVVDNFPNDTVYTPVAFVSIAEAYAELGKDQQAQAMFHEALQRWADNDYIVARSMLNIAISLDRQKRFSESQKIYKDIMERFRNSQKPGVKEIVTRAESRYYAAKEEPVRKQKKSPIRSFFERLNPFRKQAVP
ncbi:MAG: tetratricopeptide repeat protein [Candidatus Sumerlaeaceae bacterium]